MAQIAPFRGLLPPAALAQEVCSPPYDVLSTAEARALARNRPHSFLRVNRPELELGDEADPHGPEVYERGRQNLLRLIEEGALVRSPAPSFYVVRMRAGDHVQHGVVLGASVDEYEADRIKKHEKTRKAKEDDRTQHVWTLKANTGPVLLTYAARAEVDAEVERAIAAAAPALEVTDEAGVVHTLWEIGDAAAVARMETAFAGVPALYIADGHHRAAAAMRVRQRFRAEGVTAEDNPLPDHFLAVAFPDRELKIMGYHRVVRDLGGRSPSDFLAAVGAVFDLEPGPATEPTRARSFRMFVDGRWWTVRARPGTYDAADPVESLDASILQRLLLSPILGISDPRADERIDFVGGARGMGELERRCTTDMAVAFALHPVQTAELMAIADAGALMPPKSTWFEPKLRSGMVVRTLQ